MQEDATETVTFMKLSESTELSDVVNAPSQERTAVVRTREESLSSQRSQRSLQTQAAKRGVFFSKENNEAANTDCRPEKALRP